jgi:sulfite reductase beta subunit-like hemoprotein
VTTRQNFQFHFLDLEDSIVVIKLLQAGDMNSRAACGHSVRNVTASHLAGIDAEEIFDVTPYPQALTDYFMFHPLNLKLSRKFKPVFEGGIRDYAKGMLHDLAFYAAKKEGKEGWRVYCAGGTGSFPVPARLAFEFIPKEDLLIAADALMTLFHDTGNRAKIGKARFKFVVGALGQAEFDKRVNAYYERTLAEKGSALRKDLAEWLGRWKPEEGPAVKGGIPTSENPEFPRWLKTNTGVQKQKGYSFAVVKLNLGDITAAQMVVLADISRRYGNGNIRTAISQNLVLPFVPTENLGRVFDALVAIGLGEAGAHTISDVTSCPGADYCSLAVTKSMGVAGRIRSHLAAIGSKYDHLGEFEIKVSGCPNGCGQHHVGDIGMTGMMVKKNGIEEPHISLMLAGGGIEKDYQIGSRVDGRYPEESAPYVVESLVEYYLAHRKGAGETFKQFVGRVGPKVVQKEALGDLALV